MTRGETAGLGVSALAHVAILGALSLGWLAMPKPPAVSQDAVDVRLVDEVALDSLASGQATEAPAPSVAPEVAPPVPDAAPVPPTPAEPVAVVPAPRGTPPPTPRVAPTRPAPLKPAPAKSVPTKETAARPAPTRAAPAKPATARPAQTAQRGSRLGPDFLKGISATPSAGTAQAPRAVKVGAREMAGLVEAIRRQVQPCADRITNPGPGANAISTKLNLRLNRDGSFAAKPSVVGQSGVNDENGRYARRVGELAAAAFVQCAPFRLPDELYDGWSNFNLNYRLPD